MKYRILKKERGFIVEYLDVKWTLFGLKKRWKPFIKSAGMDCAWHHSSYENAVMNLVDKIKSNLNK